MMFAVMMHKTSFPTAVYCNCLKGSEIESEGWRAADRTEQHGNKKIRWNGSELCRGNETKQNEPFWCASGLGWAVVACPACDRPGQGEEPGQRIRSWYKAKTYKAHVADMLHSWAVSMNHRVGRRNFAWEGFLIFLKSSHVVSLRSSCSRFRKKAEDGGHGKPFCGGKRFLQHTIHQWIGLLEFSA